MANANVLRPIPDDFDAIQNRHTIAELRVIYSASSCTISRWFRLSGAVHDRARKPAPPKAPRAPKGFAAYAAVESKAALMARYEIAHKRLTDWLAEVGVTPPLWKADARKPRVKTVSFGRMGRLPHVSERVAVTSIYEQARDYLATALRCPIYRCDFPSGSPNQTGHYWRVGNVIVPPADLLDRAKRKGFDRAMAA
jgi:hypothetical protein